MTFKSHAITSLGVLWRLSRNTYNLKKTNLLLSWNKVVIGSCVFKTTEELLEISSWSSEVPDLVIHTSTPLLLNSGCRFRLYR